MKKSTGRLIFGIGIFLMALTVNITAWASANIMGKVADPINGKPLVGVTVVAKTNTDILEEKRQARIETKTDSKGEFKISGVLPNKQYVISVVAKTGFVGGQQYVETPGNNKTKIMNETLYLTKDPSSPGLFIVDGQLKTVMRLPKKHENHLDFGPHEIPVWRNTDPNLIFILCSNDSTQEVISQLSFMRLNENPDDSISLVFSDRKISVTTYQVGKGSAGDVTVIKAQMPKNSSKVYYGAYAGFYWRQTYVFAISPISAEAENAEFVRKKAELKKNIESADKILLGAWKDENSLSTFYADGTCKTAWDKNGYEEFGQWRVADGYIYTTAEKKKKVNENWQPVNDKKENKVKILKIDNDQYIIADNESKFWHSKRTASATAVEELNKSISNASNILIGTWKDENSRATYEPDGTCHTMYDNGNESVDLWRVSGDTLYLKGQKSKKTNANWQANNNAESAYKIVYIDNEKYTIKDNNSKLWPAARVPVEPAAAVASPAAPAQH